MKIKIYAPSVLDAFKMASDMNLALRHWEYAGPDSRSARWVWADVGTVMDHLEDLEWRMEGLEK